VICINELSFVAQAKDAYAATELMRRFAELIASAQLTLNNRKAAAHSQLYGREIAPSFTIHDWLVAKNTDPPTKRLFLALVKKGPFLEDLLAKSGGCSCRGCGKDIPFSGLAGAAHFNTVAVGLKGAGEMSEDPIVVDRCGQTRENKEVRNITEQLQLSAFQRLYRPTAKHKRYGSGTTMDLDDNTAQDVLNQGTVFGHRIYSLHDDRFYVFNPDNAGGFHGYPLDDVEVPFLVRRALS